MNPKEMLKCFIFPRYMHSENESYFCQPCYELLLYKASPMYFFMKHNEQFFPKPVIEIKSTTIYVSDNPRKKPTSSLYYIRNVTIRKNTKIQNRSAHGTFTRNHKRIIFAFQNGWGLLKASKVQTKLFCFHSRILSIVMASFFPKA